MQISFILIYCCSGKCFFILCTAFKRLLDEDDPSNYLDIPNLYVLSPLLSSLDILVSIELQVVHCWWWIRTRPNTTPWEYDLSFPFYCLVIPWAFDFQFYCKSVFVVREDPCQYWRWYPRHQSSGLQDSGCCFCSSLHLSILRVWAPRNVPCF